MTFLFLSQRRSGLEDKEGFSRRALIEEVKSEGMHLEMKSKVCLVIPEGPGADLFFIS